MKKKRIILICFIVLLSILVVMEAILFFRWLYYKPSAQNKAIRETYIERYYKVIKIEAKEGELNNIYTIITTKDDRIIDTRIVKEGYTDNNIENAYSDLLEMGTIIYNIEKINDVIKYNSSLDNGKMINDVLKKYQNSPKLENVNIREI